MKTQITQKSTLATMAQASKLWLAAVFILAGLTAYSQKNTKDKFSFKTNYYMILDKDGKVLFEGKAQKEVFKHGDTLEIETENSHQHNVCKVREKWDVTFTRYEPKNQMVLYSGEQITHWDSVDQIYMYVDFWLLNKVYMYYPDRTEVYYNKYISDL